MKFEDRIQLKLSDLTEELFEKIVAYGFYAPSGMGGPGCVIMIAEDGRSYQFYGPELNNLNYYREWASLFPVLNQCDTRQWKLAENKAIAKHKINKLCMEKGLQMDKASLHMVFTENLGTAKTTVARLFAEIMKDEKILSTGVLVEAGRADLVGEHVGATAPMVKKKFKEAEMNLAERICQMDKTKIATEVLTTIEESDIPAIPLETKRQIKKIGFAC